MIWKLHPVFCSIVYVSISFIILRREKNRKIERFYVNKIINILGLGKQRGGDGGVEGKSKC